MERVVADRPNGLWHAKQDLLPDYHEHFASAHRPPPYAALIDGSVCDPPLAKGSE